MSEVAVIVAPISTIVFIIVIVICICCCCRYCGRKQKVVVNQVNQVTAGYPPQQQPATVINMQQQHGATNPPQK